MAGGLTDTSSAWRSAAFITGSMNVPACTATTRPGRSMSSQVLTDGCVRVVTAQMSLRRYGWVKRTFAARSGSMPTPNIATSHRSSSRSGISFGKLEST